MGEVFTSELPASECPGCGDALDQATGPGKRPRAGDMSMCLSCGYLSRFTADLTLRELAPQELDDLPDEAFLELVRVQAARRMTLRDMGRGGERG